MRVLTIANHKGGVGKTATVHAMGTVLAGNGLRVLLVDTDPQSSLTRGCGAQDASGESLAEVLGGSQPGPYELSEVIKTIQPGLDLVPSDIALASVELGLVGRIGRENVLKRALAKVSNRYDLAIIDTPPSLSMLTVNALNACQAVLIPTQPQAIDLYGLRIFLETLEQVKELNPSLEVLGILVTFYDSRLNHHQAAIEAMEQADLPLLDVKIGRTVRIAEAPAIGQSIVVYAPENPRAAEYRELAEVVRKWLEKSKA